MENTPEAVVGPPDDIGRRKVVIKGKSVGKVRSPNGLLRVLRQAGLTFEDVEWRGADSTVWPDRPWLRCVTGVVVAAALLGTACALIRIGAKDAADALTFAGRMTGIVLLAAGLLEALCALAAVDYWGRRKVPQSGPVVLLGVSVALFVSLGMILMHILNRSYPWYMLMWIAIALASSWALWMLRQVWKAFRHPRRIAIGATVSILLVVTNLAYGLVYVPSVAHPVVHSTAEFAAPSLASLGGEKKALYARIRLNIKNVGQVPVYVLGSIYWIKVKPEQRPSSKYAVKGSGEFIAPPGRALGAAEEYSVDVVHEIKNPEMLAHGAVRVETETYVIRKDRLTMTADYEGSGTWRNKLVEQGKVADPPGPDDKSYKRYQSGISQSSELLNWIRGRERVTVWWIYREENPNLEVDVSQPGENKVFAPDIKNAQDRYGLARVRGSIAEAPVAELMKWAQSQRLR
ncbi:hypothetical protein [Streptomyces sp. NPDC048603]|uniref:hypothetical protein n=1 Tax=Streptomyces sp. NPDC048603 TaxID=3365577 RepID=UPI003710BE9A